MINHLIYIEQTKIIQTYGSISYFNKDMKNYSQFIFPKNWLKITVQENKLREDLLLQLESITSKKHKLTKCQTK